MQCFLICRERKRSSSARHAARKQKRSPELHDNNRVHAMQVSSRACVCAAFYLQLLPSVTFCGTTSPEPPSRSTAVHTVRNTGPEPPNRPRGHVSPSIPRLRTLPDSRPPGGKDASAITAAQALHVTGERRKICTEIVMQATYTTHDVKPREK